MPINQASQANAAESEPIYRDFDNLDSLLGELNKPKQKIGPAPSTPTEPGAEPTPGAVPMPENNYYTSFDDEPTEADPVDPEAAKRTGKRYAQVINKGLSFTASLYAKNKDSQKYSASEGEINDMAEPLSELATKYNFKLSPEFQLAFLILTIYGPKFIQAANDRRINELNDKVKELEEKEKEKELRLRELERKAQEAEKAAK